VIASSSPSADWARVILGLAEPGQPNFIAIEQDERRVTIRELAAGILRVAESLRGLDGVVAVSDADAIAHTTGVLGVVAAGGVPMLVDPSHPPALFADVVHRAACVMTISRSTPGVPHRSLDELLDAPAEPLREPPSDRPGSILLTSGTTGTPKLVVRSRAADVNAALSMPLGGFPLGLGDRFLLCVTHAGAPFLTLLMGALVARATVVREPFVPGRMEAVLRRRDITCAYFVPTMLRLIREAEGFGGAGWRAMRALQTGGERLDAELTQELLRRLPGRVHCAYGSTEIVNVTQARPGDLIDRPDTVGTANPLRRFRIVHPGSDDPVDPGHEGEVLASGAAMYSGYLGEDPAGPWYRTGDLGRVDDRGFLFITGRASGIVQVAGNRVSTEEVAAALRGHPNVEQVAVVAADDATWTTRLTAFVVPRDAALELPELVAWLTERVPRYKIPREIRLVGELPLDASGKLARRRLETNADG
jgi:feruloyl-CoA synthase